MIREHPLPGLHRRPAQVPPQPPASGAAAVPPAAGSPAAGFPAAGSSAAGSSVAVEARVLARLLQADLAAGPLLDTIAALSAEALQQASLGAAPASPAELRSTAARIATGLAVALLESDLADRIAARLAEEAPFAEGWRSCPE